MSVAILDPHQELLEQISKAYDEYFNSYNELCNSLSKSNMSVLKSLLSMRLTERDEIKFELLENIRLSVYNVKIDNEGEKKEGNEKEGEEKEGVKKEGKEDEEKEEEENFKIRLESQLTIDPITKKQEEKKESNEIALYDDINQDNIRNRKEFTKKKIYENDSNITEENNNKPKIIDPIKLIHGGFVPLSIRSSQKDSKLALSNIIYVINKRNKIIDLLNKYEKIS